MSYAFRALIILALATLGACSKNNEVLNSSQSDGFAFHLQTANTILVTDLNGNPIPDAEVMIGNAVDDPFEGNFLTTDSRGEISIPQEWDKR